MTRGLRDDYGVPSKKRPSKGGYGVRQGGRVGRELEEEKAAAAIKKIEEENTKEKAKRRARQEAEKKQLDEALGCISNAIKAYASSEPEAEALFQRAETSYTSATRERLYYPDSITAPDSLLSRAAYLKFRVKKSVEENKRPEERKSGEEIWAEEQLWAAIIAANMGDAEVAQAYYDSAMGTYRVYGITPYEKHGLVKARIDEAKLRLEEKTKVQEEPERGELLPDPQQTNAYREDIVKVKTDKKSPETSNMPLQSPSQEKKAPELFDIRYKGHEGDLIAYALSRPEFSGLDKNTIGACMNYAALLPDYREILEEDFILSKIGEAKPLRVDFATTIIFFQLEGYLRKVDYKSLAQIISQKAAEYGIDQMSKV